MIVNGRKFRDVPPFPPFQSNEILFISFFLKKSRTLHHSLYESIIEALLLRLSGSFTTFFE